MEEYEASIRYPIGKEWNPETAVNALIEPRIKTKAGAIIMPMDKQLNLKQKEDMNTSDDESD